MAQRQDRMPPQHPRPGVAHHLPDLLADVRPVAMHRAVRTRRLVFLEAAPRQTNLGVVAQYLAFGTKSRAAVVGAAIDLGMAAKVRASRCWRGWVSGMRGSSLILKLEIRNPSNRAKASSAEPHAGRGAEWFFGLSDFRFKAPTTSSQVSPCRAFP